MSTSLTTTRQPVTYKSLTLSSLYDLEELSLRVFCCCRGRLIRAQFKVGPGIVNIIRNSYVLLPFTFMGPCIVTNFIFNNQPDVLIINIYSVIKLHISGIFSAHHQEFSTVHSAWISFMQIWWPLPSSRVRMELQSNAECTVENSWWWAEKVPEICSFITE
jgi:hypothetical protein